jgi:hypothetical protein
VTRLLLAAAVFGAATYVAARPVGPLPALGPLLDPTRGVWAAARAGDPPAAQTVAIPGLGGRVEVRVDDRRVPHVFAEREEDAYAALGYLVARDRLLQLHVQTLAASGRLTELAGARALPLDREARGLGMPRAAERALRALGDTAASARVLAAYARGINAYLDGLAEADLPVEFKLSGTRPRAGSPSTRCTSSTGWGTRSPTSRPSWTAPRPPRAWATRRPRRSFPPRSRSSSPSSRTGSAPRASTRCARRRRARRAPRPRASPRPRAPSSRRVPPAWPPRSCRRWRATTGRSRRRAARAAAPCSPATRTWSSRCRRSGTRRTSSCPAGSTPTA